MIKLESGHNKIYINNDSLVDYSSGTSYTFSLIDESNNTEREISLSYSAITNRYVEFDIEITLISSEDDVNTIYLPTGTHFLTIYDDEDVIYRDFIFVEGLISDIKTINVENTTYTIK